MKRISRLLGLVALLVVPSGWALDLENIPPDLTTPPVTDEEPGPGRRVRQVNDEYAGTEVYHALYLPTDWEPGRRFPVIVEYAGNEWLTSPGTVDGSNLGYGISGGAGFIWVCLPFVDLIEGRNALWWWGDINATVEYCKTTVQRVCAEVGGDPSAVFLAGFSRGAIACNFIGLHDDEIATLWRGFICHSHYDGVDFWDYEGNDQKSALKRLRRLGNRPQFISSEMDLRPTNLYLKRAHPYGHFTFMTLPYGNHTDAWVLRDIPERQIVREWLMKTLQEQKPNRVLPIKPRPSPRHFEARRGLVR